jgi:RNA-binding protein YlmH
MAEMIKAGDVRVNWRPATKPSAEVKQGDVVSCAGKGRLEVLEVGRTKKERFAVSMLLHT